jgi:hypothetical protein
MVTVESGTGTTYVVTRGQDNTQPVAHAAGTVVRHGVSAREFRELQTHIAMRNVSTDSAIATAAGITHIHGITSGQGDVVGTDKPQTLTQKTITSPLVSGLTLTDASIVFEGATADAYETTLTVTDPTADRTITLPNVTGTVAIIDANQVLSNKTLTSDTLGSDLAAGGYKVTGLGTPSSNADAATKLYVDTKVSDLIASAPGTLDTLNELAEALGDDPNFATTMTNALAAKLALAGGTMSGAIAMGNNKITGLATPESSTDAANKGYIDTMASSAGASATAAANSAASALSYANSAATSASSANESYVAVTGLTGSGLVRDMGLITDLDTTSTTYINIATVSGNAEASASSASASATSAANSATASATSAGQAASSASSAAASATSAANSATSAAASASNAAATLASAVQASIVDAKGDLLVASAADTIARLAVGTDGYLLTAASTAANGVQWAAAPVSLPTQSGNGGKYLTTDGSTATWSAITTDPFPQIFMMMGA